MAACEAYRCIVEFGYLLNICSEADENLETLIPAVPVLSPSVHTLPLLTPIT
jgi:hypothetical protein